MLEYGTVRLSKSTEMLSLPPDAGVEPNAFTSTEDILTLPKKGLLKLCPRETKSELVQQGSSRYSRHGSGVHRQPSRLSKAVLGAPRAQADIYLGK
jgi:hypothetical protein